MPNQLYYGTITGFYIDGLPFPMPKEFKPKLIYTEIKKRSLNNTLTIDRFAFEDKLEFEFSWSLTMEEFDQFKQYANGDFVACIIDMPKNSINLNLRFTYDSYEMIGERVELQATAQQK